MEFDPGLSAPALCFELWDATIRSRGSFPTDIIATSRRQIVQARRLDFLSTSLIAWVMPLSDALTSSSCDRRAFCFLCSFLKSVFFCVSLSWSKSIRCTVNPHIASSGRQSDLINLLLSTPMRECRQYRGDNQAGCTRIIDHFGTGRSCHSKIGQPANLLVGVCRCFGEDCGVVRNPILSGVGLEQVAFVPAYAGNLRRALLEGH